MTSFSALNDQALQQPQVMIVGLCEMQLPNNNVLLIDTSAVAKVGAKTFSGSDATFGSLYSLSDFTDGTGDQAPGFTLTLAPASDAAAIALSAPSLQGSPVILSLGILVPATGLFVDTPELIISGSIDYPTLRGGEHSRLLDLEVTADTELFFMNNDVVRLSDAFHQTCFPGETGLNQVTGVLHQIWWGQAPLTGVTR
jgi:hypothetical protein